MVICSTSSISISNLDQYTSIDVGKFVKKNSTMGQTDSILTPPLQDYCIETALKSKKCMYKYNYERDVYKQHCQAEFEDYKECKKRWLELRNKIRNGQLKEFPTSKDVPSV
jgi:hypothetical protein